MSPRLRLSTAFVVYALLPGRVYAEDGAPPTAAAPPPSSVAAPAPPPDANPAAPPAPSPAPSVFALSVDIEPNAGGLDADRLRDAIAREASVRVTSAVTSDTARLVIRGAGRRAMRLELVEPGGKRTERTIELPDDTEAKSLATAALVAASLLEDEAGELLARLQAEAKKADDAARAAELERQKKAEESKPPPVAPRPTKYAPLPPCVARPRGRIRPVGADLVPYVGTSSVEPPGTVRRFSFEFLGGHSAGVAGFELGLLAAYGSGFVCGAQVSGVAGWVNGPIRGIALGGVFQGNVDPVEGLTLAGFFDLAGPVTGGQLSGFAGWADSVKGVQANGFASVTTHTLTGLQVAGTLAMADEIRGAQVGAIPIAGDVHGAQIGLIDVARTSDASIGVVQIVTEGRTKVHAVGGSNGVLTLALQHGSKYVHNFYGASVSVAGKEGTGFGPTLGIGAHVYENTRLFADIDALATVMLSSTKGGDPQALWQARAVLGVKLSKELALYAGPTYDMLLVPTGQAPRVYSLPSLTKTTKTGGGDFHISPGLVLGLRGL
ncbi:MAG TPA: hypothetical protein VHE30_28275 [Polyangiaceae bacterium]|nr:hypothetical protein [Polyangiaceae bacterium]